MLNVMLNVIDELICQYWEIFRQLKILVGDDYKRQPLMNIKLYNIRHKTILLINVFFSVSRC